MAKPRRVFQGPRQPLGGLVVPGTSNRGRFPQGQRLTPRGLLAAAEAHKRLLEQERQLGLEADQFVLQARFRDRGLQALFDGARRRTPIDTGRLRSSMRIQPSRFFATLSWNTPYATALEYGKSRSSNYVKKATLSGVARANGKRPARLAGRVRNFFWQGPPTTNPKKYKRGQKRISTRVTIPAAPGDRRRGSAMRGGGGRRPSPVSGAQRALF